MKTIALAVLIASLGAPCLLAADGQTGLPPSWSLIGNGFVSEVDGATILAEYPGSAGVMVVSPKAHGCDVRLQFEVLPLNPESVLVVMLAASAPGAASEMEFPENYDGSIGHLLGATEAYFFAFHNAAHKRTPFVRKHPFIRGTSTDLAAAPKNVMSNQWHHVEVIQLCDGDLSLSIDGNRIFDAKDNTPLGGGQIVLRLRGTKTHTASALIRNILVDEG